MSSPTKTRFDGPSITVDLWDEATLRDPFPAYVRLRAQGPAVRLARHDLIAFPRYAEVATALADWRTYSSASGVAVDDEANGMFPPGVLWSDPPEHDGFRRPLMRQLSPRRVDGDVDIIQRAADAAIDAAVGGRDVDVVADLARPFSLTVVGDVLGLPERERQDLSALSARANDFFGPASVRQRAGVAAVRELMSRALGAGDGLAPDGHAAELVAGGHAINIAGYTWPGLDTMARTVSSAVYLLAGHPEQWELLRGDPSLVPAASEEVLRLLSPIRHFTRLVTTDVEIGEHTVPAGSRVLLMYASANRDERRFPEPDRFDPLREQARHLAFGHGPHRCVGASLAQRVVHTLLHTLLRRVARIELRGEPVWTDNHAQLGLDHLPVRLVAADGSPPPQATKAAACPRATAGRTER